MLNSKPFKRFFSLSKATQQTHIVSLGLNIISFFAPNLACSSYTVTEISSVA